MSLGLYKGKDCNLVYIRTRTVDQERSCLALGHNNSDKPMLENTISTRTPLLRVRQRKKL